MRLAELRPAFLKLLGDGSYQCEGVSRAEADGIMLWCPVCAGPAAHPLICWRPHVPQTQLPSGGRWEMQGTGVEDLTLVAASSSVLVHCQSRAHFFVRGGEVILC